MFDFSKVKNTQHLTAEWILKRITDNQIFSYYFGNFKIGPAYNSKLRKDPTPSVGFFIGKSGELVYNDLAKKENYNCFQYVQRLFNCSWREALKIVATDFGLIEGEKKISEDFLEKTKTFNREERRLKQIQIMPKAWDKRSLDWWRLYEITQEELERNDVYNVDRVFVDKIEIYNPKDYPRFAYLQKYKNEQDESVDGIKIYNPFDDAHKWFNSIPIYVLFGIDSLPFLDDTVYVVKSKKDMLILLKTFTDVVATQNESLEAFPQQVLDFLLTKYKRVVLVYGVDDQGLMAAQKIYERGGVDVLFTTPRVDYDKYKIEDPADYVKWFGMDAFKDLLHSKQLYGF